jgi:hypothetical protein
VRSKKTFQLAHSKRHHHRFFHRIRKKPRERFNEGTVGEMAFGLEKGRNAVASAIAPRNGATKRVSLARRLSRRRQNGSNAGSKLTTFFN